MQRRALLSILPLATVSGCIKIPSAETENIEILATEEIATDEFPLYTNLQKDTNSNSIITEKPEENAIYIATIIQLPTPNHTPEFNIKTNSRGTQLTINYTATSTTSNTDKELNSPQVIEPRPHTMKITISNIAPGLRIKINRISQQSMEYTTKAEKKTTRLQ